VPPPQSLPVSFPFFFPSRHVGAWHDAEVQTSLAQSAFTWHFLPVPQPAQEPPQSTSVSVAF
jgi:hypothetical protein